MHIVITQALFQQLAGQTSLLNEPAIIIFLITVTAYIFSFLIYGGYLSAFAGSVGNTPFAFSDFTIVDILSILPMSIITLLNKIFHGLKGVAIFLFWYLFIPVFLGFLIYFWRGQFIFPPFTTAAIIAGQIIWICAISYVGYKNTRYFSLKFFIVIVIMTASWTVVFGSFSSSGQPASTTPPNVWVFLLNSILAFIYLIAGLVGLYVLGFATAETVVEREALSKVSRLVLQQPLPLLGKSEQVVTKSITPAKKGLFSKSSIPNITSHDVYTYCFVENHPLYIVSSFRKFSLFYVPIDGKNKKMNGCLVSISSELIYAIELVIRQRNAGDETA